MKINIISESTLFPTKGGGMHTAFLTQVELFKKWQQTVMINSLKKADITHLHSLNLFALFKLLTSKNTIITSHMLPDTFKGSYIGGYFLQKPIKKYLRFCYNRADLVLALTRHAERTLKELGVRSRIEILPNPLNTNRFKASNSLRQEGRVEFKIKKGSFVILGVGSQIPRKGLEEFIAMALKFPDYTFLWAGSSKFPWLGVETKKQKKSLQNLPANVRMLAHVPYEKMPALYNAADALLFPSFQEIASMVILEAAACGLPLVLRDLPEYKGLYGGGYLAANNFDRFAAIIKRLATDRTFYKKYSGLSLGLAAKFNSDLIGRKMLEYYNSLIKT